MDISFNGNLKWKSGSKLCCDATRGDWFSMASIGHVVSGIVVFFLALTLLTKNYGRTVKVLGKRFTNFVSYSGYMKKNAITKAAVIAVVLLLVEDLMNNITIGGECYSVESTVSKLFGCNNKEILDTRDHDSLQNFLGDNLSNMVGVGVAILIMNATKRKLQLMGVFLMAMIQLITVVTACKISEQNTI